MPKEASKKPDNKKQDAKKQDVKKLDSKKTDSKNKKHFMKDFKAELKRVIWPTPKQLLNNTVAVISVVLLTAIIVLILDFAFESLNTHGINKLKEMVENREEVVNTIDTNTESSGNTVESNEIDANDVTANEVSEEENSNSEATNEEADGNNEAE